MYILLTTISSAIFLSAPAVHARKRVRAAIATRASGATVVPCPCLGRDRPGDFGGQADERRDLGRWGWGWGGGRASSGEDVVLGSVLESPLAIVRRLLVIISAEDDIGARVGPIQRLLGARDTPAVRAVFWRGWLADGCGGSGAGDIAVESSHVL